jgi:hypothetical protein
MGQIEAVSKDDAVVRLAAACQLRAVDQEYVSHPDILAFAERLLELPDESAEAIVQEA